MKNNEIRTAETATEETTENAHATRSHLFIASRSHCAQFAAAVNQTGSI